MEQDLKIDKMKWVLYLATLISIITYSFWQQIKQLTDFSIFYIGNALFISLICFYMYYNDKKSFIKFFIFELSVANLIKELFLDPSILTLGEALLIVVIPFIWYLWNNYGKYNRLLERN